MADIRTVKLDRQLCDQILERVGSYPEVDAENLTLKDAVNATLAASLNTIPADCTPEMKKLIQICKKHSDAAMHDLFEILMEKVQQYGSQLDTAILGFSYLISDRLGWETAFPDKPEDLNFLAESTEKIYTQLTEQGERFRRARQARLGREWHNRNRLKK